MRILMNKNSEVPLYLQLEDSIRQRIARGELIPGSHVMSEAEASKAYQISRITVRKAYGELVDEGLLVRKKGKGTYIKDIRFCEEATGTSFSATCSKLGMIPSSKVVEAHHIPATKKVSDALGVKVDAPVAYMSRLRYANSLPVRLERNYYAPPYADIIDQDLSGSIYRILIDRYGVVSTRKIRNIVEIAYTDAEESRLLGIKRNAPVLKISGTLYNDQGMPVYFSEMLHLPERCVLLL